MNVVTPRTNEFQIETAPAHLSWPHPFLFEPEPFISYADLSNEARKMPTIIIAGYRFRFYSSDRVEPPHMHIIKGEKVSKVWLSPVAVEYNYG